ncbi:hypothetical protein, partial [Glutamicibacter sp. NPDC087344]|uniref:hypothetical protein n=1 Tax=Glutamicibacter sp. NPDC087344 TaxID=3363994 RepID=UPI00382EF1F4
MLPNSVKVGDDVTVIGDKFAKDGEVGIVVKNINGEGEPVVDETLSADDKGHFKHDFNTEGLPEGIYIVEVTDVDSQKTYTEYLEVKPADEAPLNLAVDITPKRLVKGEAGQVTAKGFTPGGDVSVQQSALGAVEESMNRTMIAALPAGVTADESGNVSFQVDTSDIELGNYILTLTDSATGAYAFTTFTVVEADSAADNTADNTADNAAENTDVNTADNAAENTDANTDANTADNAGENTDANTDANTADNAGENTDANTDANTADNAGENTDANTDANTADNAGENTDANTDANTADNAGENT